MRPTATLIQRNQLCRGAVPPKHTPSCSDLPVDDVRERSADPAKKETVVPSILPQLRTHGTRDRVSFESSTAATGAAAVGASAGPAPAGQGLACVSPCASKACLPLQPPTLLCATVESRRRALHAHAPPSRAGEGSEEDATSTSCLPPPQVPATETDMLRWFDEIEAQVDKLTRLEPVRGRWQ